MKKKMTTQDLYDLAKQSNVPADYADLTRDQKIRQAQARAANTKPTDPWWWLSFVGDDGFRGVCVVQAPDGLAAPARAHQLGINPGGQVLTVGVGDGSPWPVDKRNKLLTKPEILEIERQIEQAQTAKHPGRHSTDPEEKKV